MYVYVCMCVCVCIYMCVCVSVCSVIVVQVLNKFSIILFSQFPVFFFSFPVNRELGDATPPSESEATVDKRLRWPQKRLICLNQVRTERDETAKR